jgi:hypothetical protein
MKYRLEVRLYPSARQAAACEHLLTVTRRLWNALLAQRRDAWKTRRLKISSKRQYHEITELRADDPWFASAYRECEDAVLHRLDLAYQKFFSGGGHPRFKPASRWSQFEFPHGDRAVRWVKNQDRIKIPGVGSVRVRKGRARVIPAHGRAMVYRRCGKWYALFECEVAPKPLPDQRSSRPQRASQAETQLCDARCEPRDAADVGWREGRMRCSPGDRRSGSVFVADLFRMRLDCRGSERQGAIRMCEPELRLCRRCRRQCGSRNCTEGLR